jgi:hypothetical protein
VAIQLKDHLPHLQDGNVLANAASRAVSKLPRSCKLTA